MSDINSDVVKILEDLRIGVTKCKYDRCKIFDGGRFHCHEYPECTYPNNEEVTKHNEEFPKKMNCWKCHKFKPLLWTEDEEQICTRCYNEQRSEN